jgi:hypothetical protein
MGVEMHRGIFFGGGAAIDGDPVLMRRMRQDVDHDG